MRVERLALITLLLLVSYLVIAEALTRYQPPYVPVHVDGDVKAVFFDGVRLWVVYVTPEGFTTITLYTVTGGEAKPEWSVNLEGVATSVAVTSDMSLLAVALSSKKVYVYDITGALVFKVERGIRGTPIEVGIASRSGRTPDTLIIIDQWGSNYWAYAYAIDKPSLARGELWLNAYVANQLNTTEVKQLLASIVYSSATGDALPEVAVVYPKYYNVTYQVGNETKSFNVTYPYTALFRVVETPTGLAFDGVWGEDRAVPLGYEMGREPFEVKKLHYLRVYKTAREEYIAILSCDVRQYTGVNATRLVPETTALVIYDPEAGSSLVRYEDEGVGLLDFYPMGVVVDARVSSDGVVVAVGSDDYNVYVFWRSGGYYKARYSISLGAPVSSISMDTFGRLILAAGSQGMVYAIRGYDGSIYWRYPGPAGQPVVDVRAGYAAMGFANAPDNVVAFLKPSETLRYVRIRLYVPPEIRVLKPYVMQANVTVNITSETFYYAVVKSTAEAVSPGVVVLLPVGIYHVHIDHDILGIADYIVDLNTDAEIYLPVTKLTVPRYNLTVCVIDAFTGKPARLQLNITRAPWPGETTPPTETYRLVTGSNGCASIILPRAYWYVMLEPTWRFEKLELINVTNPVRLWSDTLVKALAVPRLGSLTIRVLYMRSTTPVPNATVKLVGLESGIIYTGSTDASGVLIIPLLEYDVYLVEVTARHFNKFVGRVKLNESSVYYTVNLVPLEYYLTLIPVDGELGIPLQHFTYTLTRLEDGAVVSGESEKGYVLLKLRYGTYQLEVSAPGYQPVETRIVLDSDRLLRLTVTPIYYHVRFEVYDVLDPSMPISGRIVAINLETGMRYEAQIVNNAAELYLRLGVYKVLVSSPYTRPATMTVSVTETNRVFRIGLVPLNFTVKVLPVDAELGVLVMKLGAKPGGFIACPGLGINKTLVWTGGYLKAIVPYSRCTVTVYAPGYQVESIPLTVDSNKTITVELEPVRYTLVINVASKIKAKILEFNVTVRGGPLNATMSKTFRGQATLNLRPGVYRVIITAKYHKPYQAVVNLTVQRLTLTAVLDPIRYPVTIRVVDCDTGSPVRNVRVVVTRVSPSRETFEVTSPSGIATIPLTMGDYRVVVEAPGYSEKVVMFKVPLQTSLTIPLTPRIFELVVKVYDALSNKALGNATILVFGVETGVSLRAKTGRDGSAELRLRSDVYRVVVLARNYRGFEKQLLLLNNTELDVKLEPVNYTLTLKFFDGFTRRPIAATGRLVAVRLEGGYKLNMTVSGSTVTITLPYGTYSIEVSYPGYDVKKLRVKLENNTAKDVMVPRKTVKTTIRVVDTRGSPVANAIVRLVSIENGQLVFTGLTGDDGSVEASVPWGTYMLEVEAGGYYSYSTTVVIREGITTIPVMIRPTPTKLILDLLPAIIIAGAVIGSAVWIGIRVRRRPVGAEILAEEEE